MSELSQNFVLEDDQPSVPAILEIRRNSDGQIRRDPKEWEYYGDFIWEDGNFACDCNRSLFWCRAADEPDDEKRTCGCEFYAVRLTDRHGKILYSDF